MKILAIDPGDIKSGYALLQMPDFKLISFGKEENTELRSLLPRLKENCDFVACEMIASYGMAVGRNVFDTCVWIGRFRELLGNLHYIYRKDEKICLCGDMKAKDANIRQALIDRYAKFDLKNGKGTKKCPDAFYGVSGDVWAAIAVGVAFYETERGYIAYENPN
ncbi:MAG: hypothetical protein IJ489_08795 [Clostridia bacterium]|nr:hypothetical protein [Clostridia bacterium]